MQRIKPPFFYGYLVLAVCFLCQVMGSGFVMYAFSVYVKPIATEFGWSRAKIMGASTTMGLVMGFLAPFVGRLIRTFGAKKMIAVGALIAGIGFLLLSLTQNMWQYYVSYAIVGIGSAAGGIVPTSLVVANWFKKRRGFAIGLLGAGIGLGGFSGPLLIGVYLIPHFSWRTSYIVSGVVTALLIIPLSLLIVETKPEDIGLLADGEEVSRNPEVKSKTRPPSAELNLSMARGTSVFWLMAIAFFTFSFANQSIFQNHAPHLQDIGFLAGVAASAVSFAGIGSAIGKFGFGWLCDFIPARYSLAIGSIFQVTAILILMNIKITSPVFLVWLYSLLFGLGIGSWLPAMSMTVSSIFGLASYGVIFGVMNLFAMLGGSIGPLVAGFIYDASQNYFWAFIASLGIHAIAFVSILLVRRPKSS